MEHIRFGTRSGEETWAKQGSDLITWGASRFGQSIAQVGKTIGYQRFYLVKDGNWVSKTRKTIVQSTFEGHNLDLRREWPLLACCL